MHGLRSPSPQSQRGRGRKEEDGLLGRWYPLWAWLDSIETFHENTGGDLGRMRSRMCPKLREQCCDVSQWPGSTNPALPGPLPAPLRVPALPSPLSASPSPCPSPPQTPASPSPCPSPPRWSCVPTKRERWPFLCVVLALTPLHGLRKDEVNAGSGHFNESRPEFLWKPI